MESVEYEIREPKNHNLLLKRVMGRHGKEAIKNGRLSGEYRVTCIIMRPTKPNIIEVIKN